MGNRKVGMDRVVEVQEMVSKEEDEEEQIKFLLEIVNFVIRQISSNRLVSRSTYQKIGNSRK